VGTVPYNVQHNGTASDAVYLDSKVFYIRKYLRRKMRTEFGN